MNIITVSASHLKNNLADYVNLVSFGNADVLVERHGKPVAKLVSVSKSDKNVFNVKTASSEEIKAKLDEYYGAIPDFPDPRKLRKELSSTKRL